MTDTSHKKLGSVIASPLFRRFLIPIVLTILAFALGVYFFAVPYIKDKVYDLEEKSVHASLDNIQSLISSNYLAMEAHRKTVTEAHQRELKNIILFTETFLKTKNEQVRNGVISQEEAQWSTLEELRGFRYGNEDFIWVADFNGFYLSHPDPKKNMEDFSGVRDVFGNYVLSPLIQKAIEREEGYHTYWGQRLDSDLPAEKLAYARLFPQWEWIIGTEVFVDDLEAEILVRKEKMIEELRTILKGIVIGKTGYIYIFDSWHNIIIHPDQALENTDMSAILNPSTSNKLVDDLVTVSHTDDHKLTFMGNTVSDKDHIFEQINWVKHVEGFDWYIVASVKTEELNQSSDLLRNKLLMLSAIVVALSIVLVSVMIGRLLLPVRKLSRVASLVTDGDLTARCRIEGHDEISFLANTFNTMVGRLKSNIDDLDQKVMERTKELDAANQELLSTVGQLEQHNFEVTELNRLAEKLQSCHGLDETFPVVAEILSSLFPQASGCLYIAQAIGVGDKFTPVTHWGGAPASGVELAKEDCLAFSNFRIQSTRGAGQGGCCRHIDPATNHFSLCMPLFGQQDIIGLVHLAFAPSDSAVSDLDKERQAENLKRLATTVTDQLTMAMANIKLRDRLQNLSVRDGLTGLFNRRYMEETLSREFMLAERAKNPVGVIILDVDHFKKFNDTYGHDAGDVVLVELGKLLASNVRKGDVVCRYGGEEFVVVLPGPPTEAAFQRAEILRAKVESELQIDYQGQTLKLTISLGAAFYPAHGGTPDQVLKAADTALYCAKEAGRNRTMLATG